MMHFHDFLLVFELLSASSLEHYLMISQIEMARPSRHSAKRQMRLDCTYVVDISKNICHVVEHRFDGWDEGLLWSNT